RPPGRGGGRRAGTGRVRGGHGGRRPHAPPGRPPLRPGGYCGAGDVRSPPRLDLPAETSSAGYDRPAWSVNGGIRHRPPPESAPAPEIWAAGSLPALRPPGVRARGVVVRDGRSQGEG